jgi:hypothetical protein
MPVTRKQVERILDVDEPDYRLASQLGIAVLPILLDISRESEASLAAKAIYLSALIGGESSERIIDFGSRQENPVLRVASTAGLRLLVPNSLADSSVNPLAEIAVRLLTDSDAGVRSQALKQIPKQLDSRVLNKMNEFVGDLPRDSIHRESLLGKIREFQE